MTEAYNWNELAKESPRQGIERVAFRGEHAMAVLNWIKPDLAPAPHSHPFEQLVFILEGRTRLHVGNEVIECGPGSMVRVPPDVVHWAEPVGDEVCLNLDIFAPVREDYLHLVEYQKQAARQSNTPVRSNV
jgi:quercetin dioxygenase-like cupin family protein